MRSNIEKSVFKFEKQRTFLYPREIDTFSISFVKLLNFAQFLSQYCTSFNLVYNCNLNPVCILVNKIFFKGCASF